MKIKFNFLFIIVSLLVIALISWNIYLLNKNAKLQSKVNEIEENFHYLDSYNKVIEYDLTTVRDSIRILENKIKEDQIETVSP